MRRYKKRASEEKALLGGGLLKGLRSVLFWKLGGVGLCTQICYVNSDWGVSMSV